MKEVTKFVLRVILALIFPYKILLWLFTPLTVYLLYLFLLPYSPSLQGNSIIVKESILGLIPACVAISAYYLLTFLVVIIRDVKLKTRLKIWFYGILLILGGNLIRIFILSLFIIYKDINLFYTIHMVFWKFIASLYVAFVWIFLTWRFKVKAVPVYDDYVWLIKQISRTKK